MTSEFEPTTERWQLGIEEDNPSDGIRVVDCQDVTIATIWKQPQDPERWAVSNAQLFVAAKELLEAAKNAHSSLRTFSDYVPEDEKQWVGSDSEALTALEQAIAQAEGKD